MQKNYEVSGKGKKQALGCWRSLNQLPGREKGKLQTPRWQLEPMDEVC